MASEDRPATRVIVKPGEASPRGETDWARVDAMTDEEVLAAALSDPDAQPLAPEELAKMRQVSPFWKPPAQPSDQVVDQRFPAQPELGQVSE
jgi:hypothetical protein